MTSAMARQDVIASNLANVSTVGFKGDRVVNETFADTLLYTMQGQEIGSVNYGTRVAGTITDFAQGSMRNTGNAYDLAIGGDGFFVIQQGDGTVAYTRNGQFQRTNDGYLVTGDGSYVLGPNRQPVFAGTEGDPVIRGDGQVSGPDGGQFGQIAVVSLDLTSAKKVGANAWTGTESGALPAGTMLKQGFVEASSVNSVKEMVEMITTMRSYESSQRVITSIDGTLDKAVNSVGTLG